MNRKAKFLAVLATAAGTLAFSSQASAHEPLAGAIIGGGIGAAVGGPPGAAVGAVLGTIIGAESDHGHRYRDRPYYDPAYEDPRYAPRRYAPSYYSPPPPAYYPEPTYYAPPPPVYYAPAQYVAPPVYYAPRPHYRHDRVYVEPRHGWRQGRDDRHRDGYRGRRDGQWDRGEPRWRDR
jgi:hypothetical protein